MSQKTSVRCQGTFPKEQFSRDKRRPDGRFPYCKKCKGMVAKTCNLDPEKAKARSQKHYLANRERYLEQWKSPKKLEAHRAYHKKRQAEDPEYREQAKRRARACYDAQDPEQRREERRNYKAQNKESLYWKGLRWYLPRKYKITLEEYQALVEERNGCCEICGQPPQGKYKRLAIDHCHKTGKFRGLLCSACNTAIGLLRENIQFIQNAVDYLKKHNT